MYSVLILFEIIGLLVCAGGVVLVIISCLKTIKGKKRIGGIITGAVLAFVSFSVCLLGGAYIVLSNADLKPSSDPSSRQMKESIADALNRQDTDALSTLFAEESVSGYELTRDDAEAIFNLLRSETTVESVKTTRTGMNDTAVTTYTFSIKTEAPVKRVVIVDCILRSPKDSFKGIQHISIGGRDMEKVNFGKKPDFYNHKR